MDKLSGFATSMDHSQSQKMLKNVKHQHCRSSGKIMPQTTTHNTNNFINENKRKPSITKKDDEEEEAINSNKFIRIKRIPSHSDVKVWVRPKIDEY